MVKKPTKKEEKTDKKPVREATKIEQGNINKSLKKLGKLSNTEYLEMTSLSSLELEIAELDDADSSSNDVGNGSNDVGKKDVLTHKGNKTSFKPGISGNPAGRPKGTTGISKRPAYETLSDEDKAEFGSDAKAALEWMLANARTRTEAMQIAKDLLPYQTPKIANKSGDDDKEFKLNILSEWIPKGSPLIDNED